MEKYSHQSNGNCKCQNCRNKGIARYENNPTGEMSQSEMINEGVSHKEPFDRVFEGDYGVYPMLRD